MLVSRRLFTSAMLAGGTFLASAATLALLGGAAYAQTTITPGQSGITVPSVANGFGGTLLDATTTNFSLSNSNGDTLTGNLYSEVYRVATGFDGTTNALDFYYQVQITGGNNNLTSISLTSFASANTAIAQTQSDVDGAGTTVNNPTPVGDFSNGSSANLFTATSSDTENTAGRSSAAVAGKGITFQFSGAGIGTGATSGFADPSNVFLVRTNATNYSSQGNASVQGDNAVAGQTNSTALTPTAAITVGTAPEPGALALAIPGVLGMVGMGIRRRKAA